MKKIIALALAAVMLLCLAGCGKKELPKDGTIGDTLKTDMVEITLTNFGFAEEGVSIDKEQPDILGTPIPFPYQLTGNETYDNLTLQLSQGTYVRVTDTQCVAYLEYTVKITADDMQAQGVVPVIRFNDSESYSLNGISGEVLADYFNGEYDGVYYAKTGDSWKSMYMFWSPGEEYLCRGVARIPLEVEENTDAPLTVRFYLPCSDGTYESLTFTIR